VHERLEDALAPMRQVVGFTARHGRHRPRHLLLPEWTDELAGHGPEETALVFGPEDHGLRAKHVEHCRWLVRIPSTAANPSYNLAQSVLLVLFELSRLQWAEIPRETGGHRPPWRDFYQLERIVAEVLTRVGFFGKGTPTPVPGLVKHLLRRIDPDRREMQVLLGMFGRIHGALSGRIPLQPLEERPARRRAPPAKPKRRGAGPAEPTAQEEQKEGRRLPGAGSL
jgi:tRNA/rRNA methyltransferase